MFFLLPSFLLIFPLGSSLPAFAYAKAEYCDPYLIQPPNNPYGYRLRDNRCEGLYTKEVGLAPLMVASFTKSFDDYDIKSGKNLVVDWSTPKNEPVWIRAHGLRRKLYYRMDTMQTAESKPFYWPTDILAALRILKRDLGVLGWTKHKFGSIEKTIYLPLKLHQEGNIAVTRQYSLIIVPGIQVTELYISMASVDPDGNTTSFLRDSEPLGYGYYPAETGIAVSINAPPKAGFYFLEIGAMLSPRGSLAKELWFYHDGDN
jgi:hypothetical protein